MSNSSIRIMVAIMGVFIIIGSFITLFPYLSNLVNSFESNSVDGAELAAKYPPVGKKQQLLNFFVTSSEKQVSTVAVGTVPSASSSSSNGIVAGAAIPVTSTKTTMIFTTDDDVLVFDKWEIKKVRFFRTDDEVSSVNVITVYPTTNNERIIYEVHLSKTDYLKYAEQYAYAMGDNLPLSKENKIDFTQE